MIGLKQILIVIKNSKNVRPVIFGKEIKSKDEILPSVEEFFEEKEIKVHYTVVEDIAYNLENGKHFWYNEKYYFQIVDIRT